MPSKTVPEQLRGRQPLGDGLLVDQELHHLQLVERHPRDARRQRVGARVELIGRRRLDRQPPLQRLGARQAVAGEQQALGALRAQARRPQRRRRRAPDARGRVADLGVVGDHQQVAAQREVGPAGDAEAVDLADHRRRALEQRHERADVARHHRVVDHRVPRAARVVVGGHDRRDPAASRRERRSRPPPRARAPRPSRRGHSRRRSPCRCRRARSRARPGRGRRARRTRPARR